MKIQGEKGLQRSCLGGGQLEKALKAVHTARLRNKRRVRGGNAKQAEKRTV